MQCAYSLNSLLPITMDTEIRRGINNPLPLSKIYPSIITCSLNYNEQLLDHHDILKEKSQQTGSSLPWNSTGKVSLHQTSYKADSDEELKEVWTYAGYEDILKEDAGIDKSIKVSLSLFNIVLVFIMLNVKPFIREP